MISNNLSSSLIICRMNQSDHIESVLKRYNDLRELLEEKEKQRKIEDKFRSETVEPMYSK